MALEIRKFVNYSEEIHIEGFKRIDKPLHIFAVAAVITNPWAGKYIEDLKPEIQAFAPVLGEELSNRILKLAGGPDNIEAYGKAGEYMKKYRKDKYFHMPNCFGYDSYFLLSSDVEIEDDDFDFSTTEGKTISDNRGEQAKLARQFAKHNVANRTNRIIMTKFAEIIA